MLKAILVTYLNDLQKIINRGDAREESFYHCLKDMIEAYAKLSKISKCEVGILPKTTEAGNPDFRVWDGKAHITGYIEAKKPETYNLDPIAVSEILWGTKKRQGLVETMAKQTARTMGSQVGRTIIRGILGGIFGGKK